ncbi:recombinase family protein, partial [Desulfobacterales bacterium HSG17]|nr:recombinase family protein [Desulfobacterales bacterium HSG17]
VEELNMLAIMTDDLLKKVLDVEKPGTNKTKNKKPEKNRNKKTKPEKIVKKPVQKKAVLKKPVSKKAAPKKTASKKSVPRKSVIDREGLVKIIMDMKKEGASFETIAQYLESQKIPTLSGKGKWRKQSVHKLYQQYK